jgi:mRNA interferase RelE/StbE
MGRYEVDIGDRALRELRDLPVDARRRLVEAIDDLADNPRPAGSRKLVGKDGYRVRKGDYRLLYTIDDENHRIAIYRVGHRREVYRG